ncbi:MAG TPA: hypothetical protein VGL24_00095 [Chthoniobacterales bacterium]|jgi:hypothetical protein
MKKLVAVLVIALVVAAAVWIVLRVQLAKQLAAVPALLPETTLILVEAPDLQKTRAEWHQSDLYKLWREPAVQEFLQKPLGRLPADHGGRLTLEEFFALHPKNSFLALTSLEKNEPKLIGGFHFDASPDKAREFIDRRQTEMLSRSPNAKRETIVYEQHKIETVTVAQFVFASVSDNQWYFASNDLALLKTLLDRVDHRRDKTKGSLEENAAFAAAVKHLPHTYAGMVFFDPRPFVEKLLPFVAMTGQSLPLDQLKRLRQVESIAAAIGFDHGKMRETDFVAMPEVGAEKKLRRSMLATSGANTFLYSASRIHWSDNLLASSAPAAVGLPQLVQQFTGAMKARGISLEDLQQAFGEELEIVGDWPAEAHWPTLIATLPVHDAERAKKIAEALTSVDVNGVPWSREERNGATFYSAQPFGGFVPIHPAIAVSDKFLCAGSDVELVEKALAGVAQPARELEKSATFHDASLEVPVAGSAFNYVDTRLLYERIDAAVRPLLLMGATFYPALGKTVDLAKFPPPEAIGKHLSPIVMSQRYEKDGYVTESVGPVTFREATVGLAGAVGGMFIYFQNGLKAGGPWQTGTASPTPSPDESPTVSPTPSPF